MRRIILTLSVVSSLLIGQSSSATMTIYKDGIALVKQPVSWETDRGSQVLSFDQLPPGIVKDSPFLMVNGADIQLQRMNEDIFSSGNFLQRNIGYEITVKFLDGKTESGNLIEYDGSKLSIRKRSRITHVPIRNLASITFTADTEHENIRPSLDWNAFVPNDGKVEGELVYLSTGFKWNAVYRMIVNEDLNRASLIPEAFITNSSNLDFQNIKLSLVEGALNTPGTQPQFAQRMMMAEKSFDGISTTTTEEQLGDYYIYDLPDNLALNASEGLTVRLYNPRNIAFEKTYLFENTELAQHEEPMEIEFKFSNTEENDLNVPLPAGKISIYTTRENGNIEYIGQDDLKQVPRGQDVSLTAGRAFDVIGKRKVLNYDRQKKSEEAVIQIQLINSSQEKINVKIIEHIHGDWVISDPSSNYIKSDASTIYFPVSLEPNSESYITYTYRKEWK